VPPTIRTRSDEVRAEEGMIKIITASAYWQGTGTKRDRRGEAYRD